MASHEPLLQTDREPIPRPRFPNLAFFRQWTKGQPLRETESLDYEPLYNKVYFARRKQPSRRFYGYAGIAITKHTTAYCTHAELASNSTDVDAHKLAFVSISSYSFCGTQLYSVGAGTLAILLPSSSSLWQQVLSQA